jgi:hypothetical protein
MKVKSFVSLSLLLFIPFLLKAQPFAKWDKQSLTLDKSAISRTINLGNNLNMIFMGLESDNNSIFAKEYAREFYSELNNKGFDDNSDWKLLGVKAA